MGKMSIDLDIKFPFLKLDLKMDIKLSNNYIVSRSYSRVSSVKTTFGGEKGARLKKRM